MINWNEKNTEELKRAKIKLAALDKWEHALGEMVAIHGEGGEKFMAFMSVWRQQGLSLEDLDYGDELEIEYREKKLPDGRTFLNFVNVYKSGSKDLPF
jgi:hypothetical protein